MADTITTTVISDAMTKLLTSGLDLKFNITGTLPGEEMVVAILDLVKTTETTMDPTLRNRFYTILAQQAEDIQSIWRGIWVTMGVLKA